MWGPTEKFPEISEFPQTTAHQDADALYAFKSRGFAGEIGLVIADTPLAPALYTWATGWKPASFLIQIKAPRSAPTYSVISWEHYRLRMLYPHSGGDFLPVYNLQIPRIKYHHAAMSLRFVS